MGGYEVTYKALEQGSASFTRAGQQIRDLGVAVWTQRAVETGDEDTSRVLGLAVGRLSGRLDLLAVIVDDIALALAAAALFYDIADRGVMQGLDELGAVAPAAVAPDATSVTGGLSGTTAPEVPDAG